MKLESQLPRQSPWLYVVPLLNTILLLLVYFLLSSGFVVQSGITVTPPVSASRLSGYDRARLITVAPGPTSQVYLDGKRLSLDELRDALEKEGEGERRLLVYGDQKAPYERIMEVSNIGLSLGYEVALATTPQAPTVVQQ
ncbi:MAG: biopolymer transporter ExbD [Verrucomicrobiales bacterium]|nr:biopolymer transporter ExbD [Verrucomicrobiales bacterium]MCP5556205.1 biopolymer transporter ExbD [Verrucomicrobiaceae bacterium]